MIYFTLKEHIFALLVFLLFGVHFGGIYHLFAKITLFPSVFVLNAFYAIKAKSIKPIDAQRSKRVRFNFEKNISDFLFFLILGIFYIMLSFSLLDGEIRVYTMLVYLISVFVSNKVFSGIISRILNFILNFILKIEFILVFILSFPIKFLLHLIYKLIEPLLEKFKITYYSYMLQRYLKTECNKLAKALQQNY